MSTPALLIVDVQQGFDNADYWGPRNNPQAETNIARLIAAWRHANRPLIHVQHNSTNPQSPLRPNQPGNHLKPEATPLPHEPLFTKTVNSAFIGTNLETYLHQHNITHLVIVGLTTDHCISTTTRMAANLGFTTTLIADATATFDRLGPDGTPYTAHQIHQIHLASLNEEFCTVLTTDDILATLPSGETT
ncbi:MAG TPA: cysteine hydrolase family protein [Anaerolineae bacterium]|nr:cysteine hydrolase family protein [Anaerolineae bacterium]